jgi:hypothetical protein
MRFWNLGAGLLVLAALGCATTEVSRTSLVVATSSVPDCRVARASGDLAALLRSSGELVIVGGGVELLRSTDLGQSWWREELPLSCRWPDLAEVDGRLLVSCSERNAPGRLLVIAEDPESGWSAPVEVDATDDLFIDTHLQALDGSELVLFATHVDRPDDLDDAVYTVQLYRSRDGGVVWSGAEKVVSGRRGTHLEDTRSVHLGGGSLLLAYELERAEAAPSKVRQRRSIDGGRSWSEDSVIWRGADVEPGGYVFFADGELWFVTSSDENAGGGSYDRASILMRRSVDGGRSWGSPVVLVDREDQLSFGGVVLPGDEILLPSLRHYNERKRRQLSLYVVDRDLSGSVRCASTPISADGFEGGLGPQWRRSTNR